MNEENNFLKYNKGETNKNIKTHVLDRINGGKVSMRPRFYFVIKLFSLMAVALITLITSSFLVSFIIFSIVQSGRLFLLGFGFKGAAIFFIMFPWTVLLVEILLLILLQWQIRQFRFGYRSSYATLLLIILCSSIGLSLLIEITPVHPIMMRNAERKNLPFVGDFYRDIHRPLPQQGLFKGVVSSIGTSSFILTKISDKDKDDIQEQANVILPNYASTTHFVIGDTVLIVGEEMPGSGIRAFGIQKIPAKI